MRVFLVIMSLIFLLCFLMEVWNYSKVTGEDILTENPVKEFSDSLYFSTFICKQYDISSYKDFSNKKNIIYNLKITDYTNPGVDTAKILSVVNNFFKDGDRTTNFRISEVVKKPELYGKISHLALLNEEYELQKAIEIVVVNKGVSFYEDSGGAITWGRAMSVPSEDGPGISRPIMFIREEVLYTWITAHELGHVLGLLHGFHNDDYKNNGANCDLGDKVIDTYTPPKDLAIDPHTCKCYSNNLITKEMAENYHNFMNYSPANCMKPPTPTQFRRHRKIHANNQLLQEAVYSYDNQEI